MLIWLKKAGVRNQKRNMDATNRRELSISENI
jgi:hypothetical protein